MKLKRYHINLYCPPWTRDSALKFIESLKDIKLIYSYHAKTKLAKMNSKYKSIVKNLIKEIDFSDEQWLDYVFEFSANGSNIIKKICYRFPITGLDSDVIFVISNAGKIVTIYLNDNFDKHHSLNESNYEKGDINEGASTTGS